MHGDIHITGPLVKCRVADPGVNWRCAVHCERQAGGRVVLEAVLIPATRACKTEQRYMYVGSEEEI